MKKIFLLLFCLTGVLQAQSISGNIMLGLPQGEFKNQIDRLTYGINLQGTIWEPSKRRPLTVGFSVGYQVYGESSQLRPLSSTIPDVLVEVNRTNSILNTHLLFQFSPMGGDVRPYVEGLIGGSYMFTTTSVEDEWDDYDIARHENFSDFNFSYGGGGGLLFRLTRNHHNSLFLDFKVRYLNGPRAEYIREGDVIVNRTNGSATYLITESRTDMLSYHVGVVFNF